MTSQHCTGCGETGHNVRACQRRRAPDPLLLPARKIARDDPVIAALYEHGQVCGLCRAGLNRNEENYNEIRVFYDLCGEGQRIVKVTKFASEGP